MEVCPAYLKFHIHGQEKQSEEPISSYLVGRTPRLSDNSSKWHNQPFVKSSMESEKAPTYVKTIVATTVEVKDFFVHF